MTTRDLIGTAAMVCEVTREQIAQVRATRLRLQEACSSAREAAARSTDIRRRFEVGVEDA